MSVKKTVLQIFLIFLIGGVLWGIQNIGNQSQQKNWPPTMEEIHEVHMEKVEAICKNYPQGPYEQTGPYSVTNGSAVYYGSGCYLLLDCENNQNIVTQVDDVTQQRFACEQVTNIDAKTLQSESIGRYQSYFWDEDAVYVGSPTPEAKTKLDPASFEVIDQECYRGFESESAYLKDDQFVYCWHKQIVGADPSTFVLTDEFLGAGIFKKRITKDKQSVYVESVEIVGADPKTYRVINESSFGKDRNAVFFKEFGIPNADPATFVVFEGTWDYQVADSVSQITAGTFYGRDDRQVFFQNIPILGVDLDTFIATGNNTAEDENNYYEGALPTPK